MSTTDANIRPIQCLLSTFLCSKAHSTCCSILQTDVLTFFILPMGRPRTVRHKLPSPDRWRTVLCDHWHCNYYHCIFICSPERLLDQYFVGFKKKCKQSGVCVWVGNAGDECLKAILQRLPCPCLAPVESTRKKDPKMSWRFHRFESCFVSGFYFLHDSSVYFDLLTATFRFCRNNF